MSKQKVKVFIDKVPISTLSSILSEVATGELLQIYDICGIEIYDLDFAGYLIIHRKDEESCFSNLPTFMVIVPPKAVKINSDSNEDYLRGILTVASRELPFFDEELVEKVVENYMWVGDEGDGS